MYKNKCTRICIIIYHGVRWSLKDGAYMFEKNNNHTGKTDIFWDLQLTVINVRVRHPVSVTALSLTVCRLCLLPWKISFSLSISPIWAVLLIAWRYCFFWVQQNPTRQQTPRQKRFLYWKDEANFSNRNRQQFRLTLQTNQRWAFDHLGDWYEIVFQMKGGWYLAQC